MADSWNSKVLWDQLRCASGDSSWEVGELLQLVLAGEDVWGDLGGLVLHQYTLWEATVPVAAWMVEALQTERLGRMIPVRNPSSGRKYVISERALALELLSSMSEVARDAVRSGSKSNQYSTIAALVLEALRPGIPLYLVGAEDPDGEISDASSTLLEALTSGGTAAAIDGQYERSLRAKLGMPLPPTA
jgi:hypothetical protein